MEKIDQILDSLYDRVIEPIEAKEQLLLLFGVMVELPEYELNFCSKCFQMTNHLSGKCQKCKGN